MLQFDLKYCLHETISAALVQWTAAWLMQFFPPIKYFQHGTSKGHSELQASHTSDLIKLVALPGFVSSRPSILRVVSAPSRVLTKSSVEAGKANLCWGDKSTLSSCRSLLLLLGYLGNKIIT